MAHFDSAVGLTPPRTGPCPARGSKTDKGPSVGRYQSPQRRNNAHQQVIYRASAYEPSVTSSASSRGHRDVSRDGRVNDAAIGGITSQNNTRAEPHLSGIEGAPKKTRGVLPDACMSVEIFPAPSFQDKASYLQIVDADRRRLMDIKGTFSRRSYLQKCKFGNSNR